MAAEKGDINVAKGNKNYTWFQPYVDIQSDDASRTRYAIDQYIFEYDHHIMKYHHNNSPYARDRETKSKLLKPRF
ncbi:hypothetical protein J2S00_000005 [Caldalkalibacillus uzonensis]|uniref:Transposase n=1 Tax=Caldalkalibacillus uzonensis TaxID=353224 RepID=A0ABU0CLE4_9BACI|nr:hypothetical protein [Caldalkalibacillus uzonensis]MDQ0337235.1 hypothetical protein [Caldalkalibacillus uzonensis]